MKEKLSLSEIEALGNYLEWGLYADAHHKQWYLVKIAEIIDYDISDLNEDEKGISS